MRVPIENCRIWFKFLCPQGWSQLERTEEMDVRYCKVCKKNVYYCHTEDDVLEHRAEGHCIVADFDTGQEDPTMCMGE
jgi:hypothetical protein